MKVTFNINTSQYNYIWSFHIPLNAWYGVIGDTFWICTDHRRNPNKSLTLYVYDCASGDWHKTTCNNKLTNWIYTIADKHNLWYTKSIWFNDHDRQQHKKEREDQHFKNLNNCMKHSRKHKKSGGTFKDNKNIVTDYECSNKPLHDFNRYYNY